MNKYRVLIIDDERLIREGLKSYIDWSALNAEVVAICADGREDVQAIETHHPHIVLTDVSMPNMDGIALLKYVREKHIACEFILISSYSEFRYAQEALKLGAFDYILKPIEPDALYACVKRCVEKVEKTLAPSSAMPLSPEIMTEWLRNVLVAVPAAESALQRMLGMAGLDTDALALLVAVDPAQVLLPNDGLPFATALSAHITVFLCRDDASARATAQLCKTEHFRILPLSGASIRGKRPGYSGHATPPARRPARDLRPSGTNAAHRPQPPERIFSRLLPSIGGTFPFSPAQCALCGKVPGRVAVV